ncbi:amidase family protein [Burkholderia multivorans]|uniref:amidase family protein n=1 Tax=Burkholderia multivorans TaxID=87883 RepID=UPI001C2157B7|nr:amidase family protein [Burkholderia multivorans]MBU9457557.1 hypothetical protein [Burkholderia multivorans]
MTATEAVSAIATGRLSAETYVCTLLARASSLANLHAFITLNPGAIASARAVDAARAAGQKLPPLAGLPIVVKDNINTKDLPTTGGTPRLQSFQPDNDAVVLQRLLAAGAVVLGKTNMHELAFGTTTTNFASFAGFCRNPDDTARMVGELVGRYRSCDCSADVPGWSWHRYRRIRANSRGVERNRWTPPFRR